MRPARRTTQGTIRQEGQPIRIACALIAFAIAIAGCGGGAKPKKDPEPAAQAQQEPEEFHRAHAGPGDAIQYANAKGNKATDGTGARQIIYKIWWESAQLDYGEEGAFGGQMKTVRGEIYEDGKVKSTFTADSGSADKTTSLLKLSGRVRVKSVGADAKDPKAAANGSEQVELTCERLEWRNAGTSAGPDKKPTGVIQAMGNVTVKMATGGKVGPLPEILATADLKTVGTPEAFKNR
jgi:hypothetical protein